jgi:hypothetical protein
MLIVELHNEPAPDSVTDTRTGVRRWGITLAAAVTSFATLDLVATAGGITLASSGIFQGQGRSMVYGLLAISYLIWAAAMRVNLRANADLLTTTGTSTNVFSKFLFDRATSRSASPRACALAASIGYVGMQVVIEMPYYISAFGAAAASDMIDSTDALIFVAGSNVAAAAYEYVVGHITNSVVIRRSHHLAEPAVLSW